MGCSRASTGCQACYAERQALRFSGPDQPWAGLVRKVNGHAAWTGEVRFAEHRLDEPLRWTRPRLIFVCSTSDLFHETVPDAWIDKLFAVMALAPRHTFQVLTKRARRLHDYFADLQDRERAIGAAMLELPGGADSDIPRLPLKNVWIGVSVENQEFALQRIPYLLRTPAAVHWLSCEPLLGMIDLESACEIAFRGETVSSTSDGARMARALRRGDTSRLDWVVAGGESGPGARPMHPDWARSLRDQCDAAGVSFFFKQWGAWQIASAENGRLDCNMASNKAVWVHTDGCLTKPSYLREDGNDQFDPIAMIQVGKKRAGRLLDGALHDEYPPGTSIVAR